MYWHTISSYGIVQLGLFCEGFRAEISEWVDGGDASTEHSTAWQYWIELSLCTAKLALTFSPTTVPQVWLCPGEYLLRFGSSGCAVCFSGSALDGWEVPAVAAHISDCGADFAFPLSLLCCHCCCSPCSKERQYTSLFCCDFCGVKSLLRLSGCLEQLYSVTVASQ